MNAAVWSGARTTTSVTSQQSPSERCRREAMKRNWKVRPKAGRDVSPISASFDWSRASTDRNSPPLLFLSTTQNHIIDFVAGVNCNLRRTSDDVLSTHCLVG